MASHGDRDLRVERPEKEKDRREERDRRRKGKEPIKFSDEDEKFEIISSLEKGFAFVEKVKEKLPTHEAYMEFLKCLHNYSKETITRQELQSLVDKMLGKFPDLMEGFDDFIAECEKTDMKIEKVFRMVQPENSNFQ